MNETYLPLEVTPEQRDNLQLLAAYLLGAEVDDFDMRRFRNFAGSYKGIALLEYVSEHPCGTVGCAVGHGPDAGIAPIPTDTSWADYAVRAFGAGEFTTYSDDYRVSTLNGPVWLWLFDERWASTDNTARGAAKRIQIALTKGIPSNHIDQRTGYAELEYQP